MKTSLKNKLKAMLMVGGATLGAPAAMTTVANAASQEVKMEANKELSPAIEKVLNKYGDQRITLKIGGKTYKGKASDIKAILKGDKPMVVKESKKSTPKKTESKNDKAKELSVDEETKEVFELINKERAKAGLKPLKYDAEMEKVANIRAKELEQRWSHTRPDGRAWNTAHKRLNGENLSKGYNDPERMVKAWMNSPSHRKNILHTRYNSLGMGKHVAPDGTVYWAQSFSDS